MVTAAAIALGVASVVSLAVRIAGLNSRPRWFELRGGPYDGEYALLEPDATEWVTEGMYADVTYRRCAENHFHHVGGGDYVA